MVVRLIAESEGGITYRDAMEMTDLERMSLWIALREAKGYRYNYDAKPGQDPWTEPDYMKKGNAANG